MTNNNQRSLTGCYDVITSPENLVLSYVVYREDLRLDVTVAHSYPKTPGMSSSDVKLGPGLGSPRFFFR
jgi:hypothetical protein